MKLKENIELKLGLYDEQVATLTAFLVSEKNITDKRMINRGPKEPFANLIRCEFDSDNNNFVVILNITTKFQIDPDPDRGMSCFSQDPVYYTVPLEYLRRLMKSIDLFD